MKFSVSPNSYAAESIISFSPYIFVLSVITLSSIAPAAIATRYEGIGIFYS